MDNYSDHNHDFTDGSDYEANDRTSVLSSPPNVFVGFAKFFGVFSIFCSFFNLFFIAFLCGGLAIILAVLSKGYEKKMEKNALIGMISGIIGITLQMIIFGISIYNILYVPEYKELFNNIYEQIYGETFDDSIDQWFTLPERNGGNL